MSENLKYDLRGVSADKHDVHNAIAGLDKGLYPYAFCKVLPDYAGNDDAYCNVMHADTAGTKTALAYLYWKETGDASVWKNIVQDALVMNLDDLICIGATSGIVFSSTIGRNRNLIPGDVVKKLIEGAAELANDLQKLGVDVHLAGGETADVGDIVRTLDVGFTAFVRMKRSDVIVNDIRPGQVVVGLASYGQATYETEYNGGMGSNGLTSARHDVLDKFYKHTYPESFDPLMPDEVLYSGSHRLTDIEPETGLHVGKLVLSPTRTYAPVIHRVLQSVRPHIRGMIHCSGGGQTKVLKFLPDKSRVVKNNLLPIPPLFRLIQETSETPWEEMYKVFNMGHRLELYMDHEDAASEVIRIAKEFGIEATVIGRVEAADRAEVAIEGPHGNYLYH
ncbi:MAG: phosphoribosylformylglycinamidine cyclo-ligase [Flavobacteriales bacterium]|nr:phosphoribosylformylglycinamidine cyclo-ligase [Flavobacteriales bacterium]MCB9447440.1 phosphoribosylformylglycinamidine cyclo-ligase [Flavobacteriales bacterium]